MSDSNELAPFKLTKDLYQTTVEFSASEAELMLRYAEYCLANNIIVPEDGAAQRYRFPVFNESAGRAGRGRVHRA